MGKRPLKAGVAAWPPATAMAVAWLMVIAAYAGIGPLVGPSPGGEESDHAFEGLALAYMLLLAWLAWLPLAITLLVATFRRARAPFALGKAGTAWFAVLCLVQLAVAVHVLLELTEPYERWGWGSAAMVTVGASAAVAAALTAWLAWRGQPAPSGPAATAETR